MEAFEQSDSFMTDFDQFGANIHDRPKVGKSLGLVEYDFPSINKEFLEKTFQKTDARRQLFMAGPKKKSTQELKQDSGLFAKFKSLFSS